jgi:hypothetical protein
MERRQATTHGWIQVFPREKARMRREMQEASSSWEWESIFVHVDAPVLLAQCRNSPDFAPHFEGQKGRRQQKMDGEGDTKRLLVRKNERNESIMW